MKKLAIILCMVLVSVQVFGQGRVTTRKYRFSDFPDKITKVVMSGNDIADSALRDAVVENWTLSPFEFCSLEEYEALIGSPDYYFLIEMEGKFKGEKEAGIVFLTLLKGGPDDPDSPTPRTEVITLPLCPASVLSGRELFFVKALVKGIQEFTAQAMESEKVAYQGPSWFNERFADKGRIRRIYMSEDDLSPKVSERDKDRYIDEDFLLVDEDQADEVYLAGTFNTLVSYVVAAPDPVLNASYCYKMLFDAESESLYYYHRHKITARSGVGFVTDDLRRISRKR